LIAVKSYLWMSQLAPVTISTHQHQLRGSCGADMTCVFLRLVAEMSDRFFEQRIDIKFCMKLGNNTSDTCTLPSETNGGEAMKK
jgi:hypothetical protein